MESMQGLPCSLSALESALSMPGDACPLLMFFLFTRRVQQHKDEHSDAVFDMQLATTESDCPVSHSAGDDGAFNCTDAGQTLQS